MHGFHHQRSDTQQQFDDIVRRMKRWPVKRLLTPVIGIILILWVTSGIYKVGPGEVGVVLQFGRHVRIAEPGLNFRLPWPIQTHDVVNVRSVRSAEIGYRTLDNRRTGRSIQRIAEEALMLTGDENIVEVQLFVQYIVQDPVKFLFRARDPEETLAATAEVALRSVVGRNTIDHTMTEGRGEVEADLREHLQFLLDGYETGLLATEVRLLVVDAPDQVRNAFHDVVRAWEDRERITQEAEGYSEDILPRARGEAIEMIREAEAYRERRILRAQGEADRFLAVLAEYKTAPEITRERLYLETMERILPHPEKIIFSDNASQVLPLLPLNSLDGSTGGTGRSGR